MKILKTMKKITKLFLSAILIISVLAPIKQASADDIDQKTARQVGAYFLASQFGDKAITPSSLEQVYSIENSDLDKTAIYVFNTADKRGFVVVSGSECVDPIIAYSTEGSFDPNNIAPGLQWWLNDQAEPIIYAQNNAIEASEESTIAWRTLIDEKLPYFGSNTKDNEIIRLLTSTWNQEPLYNAMCPVDNTGHLSVIGCVATAMAQIMYYWRYPRKGNSSVAYLNSGQYIEADFSAAYYDYDNMVDALTSSSTQEQIDAVALLSYHCGVSVKMGYSSESSGAVSADVPKAMYKYFKYVQDSIKFVERKNTQYYNANSTTAPNEKDTLWVNMLIKQIKMKRPVYYSGHDNNGGTHSGHAFVCDGWNPNSKTMHFNWGWGGAGDCWCNVYKSNLKPQGGSLSSYKFSSSHAVITGITPPLDSIPENLRPVSINTVDDPFAAAIYPNPASEQITVSYTIPAGQNAELQVFDVTGRCVKQMTVTSNSNQVTVSVADLRPGVYVCRLQGYSKKFIVK